MPELSAVRKHPCPKCGGDAEWDPAKKALACPYCGTLVPWAEEGAPGGEGIVEHDLQAALRAESAAGKTAEGKETARRLVRCGSCHAITLFDPGRVAQKCEFCGSPEIVPLENQNVVTPESLLPASVSSNEVRDALRTWYGNRWFAPNGLKKAALTDTLSGVYLPYWTFDAQANAAWTAESGYYYYVTEEVRGPDGKVTTHQVRKVRWEPSSGSLSHFFDDDLVPGTVGVRLELLRQVEPFPTREKLQPYDPAYVRGWVVECYQVDLKAAAEIDRTQMDAELERLCAGEVPGDTYRFLQVETDYHQRTFKHILVPVWLATYTYGQRSFQVVVNGFTGTIAGEYPKSWVKIGLAVLAIAVLILLAVLYVSR